MDPQRITELANLLRNNGDKILNSEFKLTLSGSLLRALNDSFTLIADSVDIGATQTFQVAKPINSKSPVFRDLQLVHDFVQKTALLCIIHYPAEEYFDGVIDIGKFRALQRLEIQKVNVQQIIGIQPLRSQLQQLICMKSLRSVEDIITHCGGDNSNGFVWNELKIADFSYNNLQTVDSSLEFAQYLQHLNLRHNRLHSVEAIKWLPYLKTLDLSYNRLTYIPQFHMEAYKRLQSLNMSNNFVEDLMGIAKLDALTDLDLSDNCLLDHSYLLPLSALITLKFLSLYGNPLHCHPKHRLATAQFLHKNTATVKFILDFEPLSKNEKAITGSQQLRYVGSFNRITTRSSSASMNSGRLTPVTQTPASSVGSLRSFNLQDSSSDAGGDLQISKVSTKKRTAKVRTVEILDNNKTVDDTDDHDNNIVFNKTSTHKTEGNLMNQSLIGDTNTGYLETKKHIESLREKYGTEWLQSGNAEMLHSVLGIESIGNADNINKERNISRQELNEFLDEFPTMPTIDNHNENNQNSSATAIDSSMPKAVAHVIPVETNTSNDSKTFLSLDESNTNETMYNTAYDDKNTPKHQVHVENMTETYKIIDDSIKSNVKENGGQSICLENIYSSRNANEEPEISEPEDDEETYIVYTTERNEAMFLTLSSNFLREKDTLTQRTKTKWSLKILESCDRIKSNTLRINFDTVKLDKQERIYAVEDDLCQELESKLRDILSQRDLMEMNQTIYRCVNCSCQFSRENKYLKQNREIRCPDCRSTFIAEIHDIPKSSDKQQIKCDIKLSPAAIVEESPVDVSCSNTKSNVNNAENIGESTSIGKGLSRLTGINTQKCGILMQSLKSSANSLNESSSCSKITNSQSSFDSNQSVAGSSTTDRDIDFKSNCESDVDILSNPSQSSIEVLDQIHYSSRKTSEERRISQIPNLETIDDHSYTQTCIDNEFNNSNMKSEQRIASTEYAIGKTASTIPLIATATLTAKTTTTTTTTDELNLTPTKIKTKSPTCTLTESSSSGSVTDSVCTAYEQADKILVAEEIQSTDQDKVVLDRLLIENPKLGSHGNTEDKPVATIKREDSGISSMFALFQSTNLLMSSSKKQIDTETKSNSSQSKNESNTHLSASKLQFKPYKFNYVDFNDIDHRLKLYFYQTKFEEKNEHFKWIARGRILNENNYTLTDGVVVMSTNKIYVMEAFANEHEDVRKWLRPMLAVTVDRLESIQLLPWKIGLSFFLRDWGGFLLLLQDILRTDSLLLFFANNSLPAQCELRYHTPLVISKRLNSAITDEKLKMCSILNGCEIQADNAKRSFQICCLLTTDARLYLTSQKFNWLSPTNNSNTETDMAIEICVTQFMSNLVDVERPADNIFTINFLDDTHDKCELWKCTFETKENAESCLNTISQSWQQLFGVPLLNVT